MQGVVRKNSVQKNYFHFTMFIYIYTKIWGNIKKKSLSTVVTLITVVSISLAIFIVSTLFIVSAKNTLLDNLKQKADVSGCGEVQ